MASRRAAVLGSPIAHSRSPILHRAAYAALGLDWTYDAIEMTPDGLAAFLAECHWPQWAGLSLTMPLKTDVLPLLDDVTDLAEQLQAANTVVFNEQGAIGHNTDVAGMKRALSEAHGPGLTVSRGLVIGSGATARSAMAALAGLGARGIVVIARSPERAWALRELADDLGLEFETAAWDERAPLRADAVIATVPPGVADSLVERVPAAPGVLLDVAYGAGTSALARAWSDRGGAVADGLDLLLWQAVDQVRLMTGQEPPAAVMQQALAADRSGLA